MQQGSGGSATSTARDAAVSWAREQREHFLQTLITLSRIPSVSAPGFPEHELRRSAEAMVAVLKDCGLDRAEVLDVPGVHPYAYAEWMGRPGAPTLLLYGHHDVMPPGRPEKWLSPPFEPEIRNGRLYGRGTADDKGGVMVHVAAVASYLKATGSLPCNVRFVIEGEEEIGSGNLARFLEMYADRLQADVLVLSDTANFDVGRPALTWRLRGLAQVDVEVRCLSAPMHSGRAGGPTPDAIRILCALIAGLEREDGSLDVPGLYDRVVPLTAEQKALTDGLPFDEQRFRRAMGMLDGTRLVREPGLSIYEQVWARPALTVIAIESQAIEGSSNQVVDSARARLSLRTVPAMVGQEAGALLARRLTTDPPHGAQVTASVVRSSPWWVTTPEGPAFDAARRAFRAGFGVEPVMMGSGGSIGFVQPFADFLQGAPCLLMGVEDPACHAHSENESLHLDDWDRCVVSAIHLYDELGAVGDRLR